MDQCNPIPNELQWYTIDYETEQPAGADGELVTDCQLQASILTDRCRSVLAVEDDPIQQRILRAYLELLELHVLAAGTLDEASQLLRENVIALAIIDIHLPDGNGLDLCRHMDETPRLAGLPTIILSGGTHDDLVRRTRAAGGCYFIGKPYDPNVLLAIIEKALGEDLQ